MCNYCLPLDQRRPRAFSVVGPHVLPRGVCCGNRIRHHKGGELQKDAGLGEGATDQPLRGDQYVVSTLSHLLLLLLWLLVPTCFFHVVLNDPCACSFPSLASVCPVLVVVGNKADLEKFRKVSKATAEDYARNIGALGYVEASAKVPSPSLLLASLSAFFLLSFMANTLCC